ncbi:unnamed protein product [Heligmosomoides polygyrus]|uniref:Endo/exonuclease/phosphatase domain-containing protein n=1 Tax=Heligmosomoides polygyrus TaxID=6339 RepID=A0A183G778_HELPZ|nr:unnamed protein product [Heligmosomoides polygyrus]
MTPEKNCPSCDMRQQGSPGAVKAFYVELEEFYKKDHTFYKAIVGDFNAKIGPRRSPRELHIGTHSWEWNEQGSGSLPPYDGPGNPRWLEIDHIIFNYMYRLTDVSVIPKFYTGSDHRLLRVRFRFSRQGEKAAKFKKRSPRTTIN